MLNDELKKTIQTAYSRVLENKGLKPRYGQKVMIAEIARLLAAAPGEQREIDADDAEFEPFCVIEAGTGTGKTLAYILATLPMAQAADKKVVIATATVALQEQIVYRDLPDILQHSGLKFSFALAKGRSRYVCLSKLDNLLAGGGQHNYSLAFFPDESRPSVDADAVGIYHSMLDALASGRWEGDRDSWPQELDDSVWIAATSDRNQCTGRRCPNVSQCSFFRAREDLHSADCIVTNHDLVLADLALGGGAVLPDPAETIFIFDEGHHLPDRALGHFTASTRLHGSLHWLDQLLKQLAAMAKQLGSVKTLATHLSDIPSQVEQLKQFTTLVVPLVESIVERSEVNSKKDRQIMTCRFPHGEAPQALREIAAELAPLYLRLLDRLEAVHRQVEDLLDDEYCEVPAIDLETAYALLGQLISRAQSHLALWNKYALPSAAEIPDARWLDVIEVGGLLDYELFCSPILARQQLFEHLWSRCHAAIVTSATLTAVGSFDRFQMRSGLPDGAVYKQVPSPFNYQQAVFSVPKMDCEPSDVERHTRDIIERLPLLSRDDPGTLVLFASRRQMQDVYEELSLDYQQQVLMQGDHSKMELLQRHRKAVDEGRHSVIFGLASFAEGVDLPGKYCSHVIIAKIPFAVPDDPIEAALAEWIAARGGNAFMEIAVPDAALRLVQACGRLLRSEDDSGRITLLDRRIVSKRYGQAILNSLPPFSRDVA